MAKKKKENTTSIGFEEVIWRAADKLRGNLNASEYEGVVFGLIFLKYISDKFEVKFKELAEDEYADMEDKDEYEADGVFFVPQEARWNVISLSAHTPEVGRVIDDALQAIERENPKRKGVLPGNYARPELDKRRLGDVVDLFSNIEMYASGEEKDLLGRVYEYCLQKFASMEGKNAGEFYTPSCIVRTIVEILQPFQGRVYDPCCGSGGMFVQSAKFIKNHQKELSGISVYGQEANPSTWKMAEEIKQNEEESNKLGLTVEEKAFYDALSSPEGIREAYTDEQFVALTRELTDQLRRNRTIDWNRKESARAKMRVLVKRLMKKYKYPPEGQEKALETVMAQCNKWADDDDNVVAEPETHEVHMYPRIEEESEMMLAAEPDDNFNDYKE